MKQLAQARQTLTHAKEQKQALLAAFMESDEMVQAAQAATLAEMAERVARGDLDTAALLEFEDSGNKKLHPAVSIAMVKEYDYQEPDVINWAIEHNIAFLLKVNRPAVKKFVDDPTLPVTVTEVASTRIKTDLSEYLPEDNDD